MTNLALVYSIFETMHLASDTRCKQLLSRKSKKHLWFFSEKTEIGFKFQFVPGSSFELTKMHLSNFVKLHN